MDKRFLVNFPNAFAPLIQTKIDIPDRVAKTILIKPCPWPSGLIILCMTMLQGGVELGVIQHCNLQKSSTRNEIEAESQEITCGKHGDGSVLKCFLFSFLCVDSMPLHQHQPPGKRVSKYAIIHSALQQNVVYPFWSQIGALYCPWQSKIL